MGELSTINVPLKFLLLMLSQAYNITIEHGVSEPGHLREVVD